ncbi:hypothetical protein TRICHSKD4_0434 [Roseibium sp. TrichSKD4]|uniref:hypothetical protein n=1 Tax=Roseibium sp. TrichSKD4 TaxID=744980 RepID=UPI0001E5645A|nr:hypothetical protein [Roseibium sp. TrichSKD4]EFO34137.1 hypothetical protein TRICHSKD4_0434 [Roseibium sp. TrichSKD4]
MSASHVRSPKGLLVTVVVTAVLLVASYYVFTGANDLAREYARGTLLTDLRFVVGLLAVYLFLTIADRIVSFVQGKFQKEG